MGYLPIEAYGIVGNLETCALVGRHGSVDWCPFPYLESPSAFAAILDDDDGGRFRVAPAGGGDGTQEYTPGTNVLRTAFSTDGGELRVTDFMPVRGIEYPVETPRRAVFRRAECTEGAVDVRATFDPRLDYARAATTVEATETGALARGNGEQVALVAPAPAEGGPNGATVTRTLDAGESAWFAVQYRDRRALDPDDYQAILDRTLEFWRRWSDSSATAAAELEEATGKHDALAGQYHDLLVRSGLALKLLDHWETGAIAAAPTTSLPEVVGGVRNWDYRFNWLRDAAFTVQALHRLGHDEEATDYFDWCIDQIHADSPENVDQPLYRPLYGLHGKASLTEETLDHLEGYRESTPVRVGNAAREQRQLDIYGELLLAIYETERFGQWLHEANWPAVRRIVEHVCSVWEEPDLGIWEVREEPRQFVHSKVMCWVAVDRGIRIVEEADDAAFDGPVDRWRDVRDRIRTTVLDRGYDADQGTFVRSFGSDALDAATLRIPVVGFLPPEDDRVQGTIDAVRDRLLVEDGLVRRYEGGDGLPGEDNPFLLCSYWLVDALALSNRLAEAHERFECVTRHASPLGLLAEEVDPATGEHRGNFPQAFSHIGLINSALYLRQAESEGAEPKPVGSERKRSSGRV